MAALDAGSRPWGGIGSDAFCMRATQRAATVFAGSDFAGAVRSLYVMSDIGTPVSGVVAWHAAQLFSISAGTPGGGPGGAPGAWVPAPPGGAPRAGGEPLAPPERERVLPGALAPPPVELALPEPLPPP